MEYEQHMRFLALTLLLSLSACSCLDWGACPAVFPKADR